MIRIDFKGLPGLYAVCYQAVVMSQRPIPVAEWADVVSLLRKLKSIGQASEVNKDLWDLNTRLETQFIDLERAERSSLLAFIEQPMWRAAGLEDVVSAQLLVRGAKED